MTLDKRIGIIGGGQLGKMMILDAKRLGFYVVTLDPTEHCPSHSISDEHIIASYDDVEAIKLLADKVDVITYEFEHIGIEALKLIEDAGHKVYPTVHSLEVIQNKLTQKQALKEHNILVPDFIEIKCETDLLKAIDQFGCPLMLKACTGGYDGKGNAVLKDKKSIKETFDELGSHLYDLLKSATIPEMTIMAEKFVPYTMEISVLACRGIDGDIVVYPVGENRHKDSILDETLVPAAISKACSEKAMSMAKEVMNVFEGVGMFCVEMFVTKDESILINEVAPRPHNSGHYTIEGCMTSQFEQHIRAVTGLPFGDVALRQPTVMKNLLGEIGVSGKVQVKGLEAAYKNTKAKVHIYGKTDTKPKRKMGHLTVCGETIEKALEEARKAYGYITITSDNQEGI